MVFSLLQPTVDAYVDKEASDSIEMAFTISQEYKHSRIDFLCVFMVIRWKYILI